MLVSPQCVALLLQLIRHRIERPPQVPNFVHRIRSNTHTVLGNKPACGPPQLPYWLRDRTCPDKPEYCHEQDDAQPDCTECAAAAMNFGPDTLFGNRTPQRPIAVCSVRVKVDASQPVNIPNLGVMPDATRALLRLLPQLWVLGGQPETRSELATKLPPLVWVVQVRTLLVSEVEWVLRKCERA